ncbi:MAG: DNA polymerase III subunit alpha [Bacteroidales bacterium]|nr:DNA polymerase III subunit alpha [Bacteroidales bacterium]
MSFVHLHVHTQYSILDGLSTMKGLFARARELGMPALAMTDHGNMYGVKEFFKWANDKENKDADGNFIVKPIVGCEVYVTRHYDHTLKDSEHKKYYHLILLAKNYDGYKNLMKIVSTAHTEGMYYKPRISHEVLAKYHENLICCSACLAGEVPKNIVAGDMDGAREAIQWHKDIFGDDYYLEVMLHKTEVPGLSLDVYEEQKISNEGIFTLAAEMGVKVVATNDVHFVRKEDGPTHDRLICITTNVNINEPNRLHYTQQEYLKSEEEMLALFPDHPEVIQESVSIAEKIEAYQIDRPHVLPKYSIDPKFLGDIDTYLEKYKDVIEVGKYTVFKDKKGNETGREYRGDEFCRSMAYLCHLTYEGAHQRYGQTLDESQSERIDFELKTICKMGFPDYFLIVQDYIRASRKMGYMVGPGRGSAAGRVVAYCIGITNVDPLKYGLLFERFLNPDRVSMPDIDVDFENLLAAHQYVEKTYGEDHVSRVITFGTMAAKSAIKDVARISGLSIEESNRLTKMIPDHLSEKVEVEEPFNPELDELKPGFKIIEKEEEVDDKEHPGEKVKVTKKFQKGYVDKDVKITLKNCYKLVPDFRNELEKGTDLVKDVLKYAKELEGCIRQVGMHACATIIGRGNLEDYIPITLSVDKETGRNVWTSQYDGHYIEEVGMLKMDFLGLITLSIIHATLDNIKKNHGIDIDIEAIPIDDKETYELYGRGDTTIVFQFESEGMKTWLQKLHPERLEDLIAMNALYRPGPMQYIPSFVDRKLGREPISYDLPAMSKYLADTYGITVYQEQVMLLSQELAGFTKGEADKLRKAMGKKQIAVLESLRDKFMAGGKANGHPEKTLDKIWKDWRKFAEYAFNKSHATCYAWVSYQTAYLKAHYPSEFFAANLSCNLDKMDEIKKIIADCKKHHIAVLNPDVNESGLEFTATKKGDIRFGLAGIKTFGKNVAEAIVAEREKSGVYKDLFDFVERLAPMMNRHTLECLIYSGSFDSFGLKRTQFESPTASGETLLDSIVKYALGYAKDQAGDMSMSLFGDMEELKPQRPEIPEYVPVENEVELLHREKEFVGMYLSAHPLDRYALEIENFTNSTIEDIPERIKECTEKKAVAHLSLAAFSTDFTVKTSMSGKQYSIVHIEDFTSSYEIHLMGKSHEKYLPIFNREEKNVAILINADIDKSFRNPEEYELRIISISLLSNVAEDMIREIKIYVDSAQVTPEFRKNLVKVLRAHKGKTPVSFAIYDRKKSYSAEVTSGKFTVEASQLLSDELEEVGIKCSVVKK